MDKNMKILIIDDFSTMRRIIKNLLRDLGFTNTAEADDGTSALPMLQSGSFDFLVTDWNMPGMTGIDLLALGYQQRIVVAIGTEVGVVMLNDQQRAIAGHASARIYHHTWCRCLHRRASLANQINTFVPLS